MNKLRESVRKIFQLLLNVIKQYPIISGLFILYLIIELRCITWGVPNEQHPFLYQMDEWHQMAAVKSLFKSGTSNVAGAANGPIFSFFLAGLFLAPFILLGIIHPFQIHSSIALLSEQEKIFITARLETLFFGILTLAACVYLCKQLRIQPLSLCLSLFIFTPIWLTLSNYFKYDITVLFWVVVSLCSYFWFGKKPTRERFLVAGILTGLSIATKISAIPLIPLYIFIFFWLGNRPIVWRTLALGLAVCIITFVIFGIPDIFRSFSNYYEFFYSNLVTNPNETSKYLLGMPYVWYLLLNQFPMNFGYGLTALFAVTIGYGIYTVNNNWRKLYTKQYREMVVIILGFLLFLLSLNALKLFASGNRALVLLPFIILLCGLFVTKVMQRRNKFLIYSFIGIIILLQIVQSIAWVSIKWYPDVRAASSQWIVSHIPNNSIIGVENIPIYQMLPDELLKEFYEKQYNPKTHTKYDIVVISPKMKNLPSYVVITNSDITQYQKSSLKKDLMKRLQSDKYHVIATFTPMLQWYHFFGNDLSFYIPDLVPAPVDIMIYKR